MALRAFGSSALQMMFLLSAMTPGFPLSAFSQGPSVVVVEHADSLVGKIIAGEEARELMGNVEFTHDQVRVSCDRATEYRRSGRMVLTGNVVVRDDSVTMRAAAAEYYRNERRADAFQGVMLEDGRVTLTARNAQYFTGPKKARFWTDVVVQEAGSTVIADSFFYDRLDKHSVARGKVTVLERDDNLTISGTHLEHWSQTQFSRMTGSPVLVQFDTTLSGSVDTLVVYSRIMESYRSEPKRMVAIDSVRIIRSDLAAISELAQFSPAGDSVSLRTSPVVWYGKTQIVGDSITIYMKSRLLDRVLVMGNAYGTSRIDSGGVVRFDQLSGEFMKMYFLERRLSKVEVDHQATSLYHLFEDTLANGLNKTSGDRVVMSFQGGKLSSIVVSGGAEGQYVPENLLRGGESAYHLPGFGWRDDRPHLRIQDVTSASQSIHPR